MLLVVLCNAVKMGSSFAPSSADSPVGAPARSISEVAAIATELLLVVLRRPEVEWASSTMSQWVQGSLEIQFSVLCLASINTVATTSTADRDSYRYEGKGPQPSWSKTTSDVGRGVEHHNNELILKVFDSELGGGGSHIIICPPFQ
jgi:hypothetical protein